jgi:VWFA-related protein
MTGRQGLAAIAAGVAVLRGAAQTPAQPPQTFRTGTDVVMVDVSVRDGARAVPGLGVEDFVLTDNGVRQKIASVEPTAVPIDLTLVVDVSGNARGAWDKPPPMAKFVGQVQHEVAEVTRALRADDRVRLLAVDRLVQQIWPMRAVSAQVPIRQVDFDGLPALYDTLAAALIQPVEPARRHVVIARTYGHDAISSVNAEAVREIAERSDALFHLVVSESDADRDAALIGFQCEHMGLCWPTRRFWVPFERHLVNTSPGHPLMPDGRTIADGAAATGGRLHQAAFIAEPSLTGTFKRAFEDFRTSYVLRYTPSGVTRGGWHAIEVRVPRFRSYTVRSRKGYAVEAPPSPRSPRSVPDVPATLADLTNAYERAAHRQVVVGLRQVAEPTRLIRQFEEGGNPWPANPRREAAFALELAEPGIYSSREENRDAARDLLQRFSRLIRHPIQPDAFERYWHFAALTLLEGTLRPTLTEPFVERALQRFPDEPRFVLSRAIAADQKWATGGQGGQVIEGAGKPSPAEADVVRRHYEAAIAFPATAIEARIRLAWFLHRTGHRQDALNQLTNAAAQPITDPALNYLHKLFLGHVLAALDRRSDAIAAYRDALTVGVAAQSARVSLMNALLLDGDRPGAEALAELVQTDRSEGIDPWWMYWQGQYRLYPQAIARLREMTQ